MSPNKISKEMEQTLDGLSKSIGKLIARENKPSLIERAEGIRLERIHNIITAYKLISEKDTSYLSEDMQDYYKDAINGNKDISKELVEKLKNSYLAFRPHLINELENITGRKNAEKICLWYGRNYGQDNGWTYINKAHLDRWKNELI